MEKTNSQEISNAAAALGSKGGSVKSEAKAAAARENGKKGGRPAYSSTYHRDGTVTYWDVYQQQWVRQQAGSIRDEVLASLPQRERDRIARITAKE